MRVVAGRRGSERRILAGNGGDDIVSGGAGEDFLHGGTGNDSLSGGDAYDFFIGDLGDDTMDGGAGDDGVSYEDDPGPVAVDLRVGSPSTARAEPTRSSISGKYTGRISATC